MLHIDFNLWDFGRGKMVRRKQFYVYHSTINAQGMLVDAIQNISCEGSAFLLQLKLLVLTGKEKTTRADKSERLAI